MTKLEAFLIVVAFLVAVLGYIWRRLGEPPPPQADPPDNLTNIS
jgi:hypothetical protein